MTPSSKCFELIKSEEGCILHPYRDKAGVPTIGWGTTRYPNGVRVKMTDPPRTQPEVDAYLNHDVGVVSFELDEFNLPVLKQNQYDPLVDFSYNEGIEALHGSTLLRLIMADPNDPRIGDAFKLWDKIHVDGILEVCDDLVRRRKNEVILYFS